MRLKVIQQNCRPSAIFIPVFTETDESLPVQIKKETAYRPCGENFCLVSLIETVTVVVFSKPVDKLTALLFSDILFSNSILKRYSKIDVISVVFPDLFTGKPCNRGNVSIIAGIMNIRPDRKNRYIL